MAMEIHLGWRGNFVSLSVISLSMSPACQVKGHNKLLTTLPYRSFPDTLVTTRISPIAPQTLIATTQNRFGFIAIPIFTSASLKSTTFQ
ncbi:uncharacterized protein K444DRAFT_19351 [Hyaloscypha bicolor E]|uniref:Uncharacterized protein n=1 Tax=Hyaloscypha bicolor E TaxID=1095630 RepID=A0A2J6TXA2_9HELO|nr:uncharacterized protein K444DRAFT_19351 [Hyaloscypha bicolor E]PMD67659.1 hypothetical protein K444DRAFT_19351 [Hyaloscypha bicolor E]